MKPGDRLTMLFSEHGFVVSGGHPYTLESALKHIEGIGTAARHLDVVVVEVISAEAALERANRDTLPAPEPVPSQRPGLSGGMLDRLFQGVVSAPEHEIPEDEEEC